VTAQFAGRACVAAVAIVVAGCHGNPIHEVGPDGGAGAGGSGGGGAGGGSGGAACAAQMQPVMFYEGMSTPVSSDGTGSRYYWVEYDNPNFAVHYTEGAAPAAEKRHPFQIDASIAYRFNVAFSDTRVAATWNPQGELAVYGADSTSTQIGPTMTLTAPSAVTVSGTMAFYAYNPASGTPTPGIYQWMPPAAATPFESYADLGGDATLGLLLRMSATKVLLSDLVDVRMVGYSTKGAARSLFTNPGAHGVTDVRPARPHDHDGGVLVQLQDDAVFGRDYYVDITMPDNAPTDLAAAVNALADASACGAAAHYHGPGNLFRSQYIYEGDAGLFAVDVSATGVVSRLVRLTDLPLLRPDVTGAGDLFASGPIPSSTTWAYYRVGNVSSASAQLGR